MAIDKKLVVSLVGDASHLQKTFKDVSKEAERFGKQIEKHGFSYQKLGKTMMAIGGSIVGAMTATVVAVANVADQIDHSSKMAGLSAEQYQKLAYAAEQNNVSTAAFDTSLQRLNRSIYEASEGNKTYADAFSKLGISVKEEDGTLRSTNDVLMEMADRFSQIEDPAIKTGIAMDLFGRSGAQLIPMLEDGSAGIQELMDRADDLGIVMSNQAVSGLEKLADTLLDVKLGMGGFGKQIASDIYPVVQLLADGIIWVIEQLNKIPAPIKQAITVGTGLAAAVALIGGAFIAIGPAIWAATAPLLPFIVAAGALGAAAAVIYSNWDQVCAFFEATWDQVCNFVTTNINSLILSFDNMILGLLRGLDKATGWIPGWGDKLASAIAAVEEDAQKRSQTAQEAGQKKQEWNYQEHLNRRLEAKKQHDKQQINLEIQTQGNLTEEEEEAKKEREKLEKEWSDKLFDLRASALEKLQKEEEEALAQTNLTEKAKQDIKTYYALQREKLEEEETKKQKAENEKRQREAEQAEQKRLQLKEDIEKRLFNLQHSEYERRLNDLRLAERKELNNVNLTEKQKLQIKKIYALEREKLEEEHAKKIIETQKNIANNTLTITQDIVGRISAIYSQDFKNRELELDNWYTKQKEIIETTILDEEEKAMALAALDEELDAKKRKMAREQAKVEKEAAIFSIIIQTAQAIVEALPNLVLAGVIAGLGAVQLAKVMEQPLPALAAGGMVTQPTVTLIGEGPDHEAVLPLNAKVYTQLAEGITKQLNVPATTSQTTTNNTKNEVHLHVGTLVADDLGLKKLNRELEKYRIQEAKRRGQ